MAKNTLRGIFTLVLPSGLIISGCMLHEKNGKRWVSLHAREYTDQQGERQVVPVPFLAFVDRPDGIPTFRFSEHQSGTSAWRMCRGKAGNYRAVT
jgi:hypothetical protein